MKGINYHPHLDLLKDFYLPHRYLKIIVLIAAFIAI